jgi:hypothetical protein
MQASRASQTDPMKSSPAQVNEYKYYVALADFTSCDINHPSAFAKADALAYAYSLHMQARTASLLPPLTQPPQMQARTASLLPPLTQPPEVQQANSIVNVPRNASTCPATIDLLELHWMFQMCRLLTLYMASFTCPILFTEVRTDPFDVVTNQKTHRIKSRFYEILETPWAYVLIFRGAQRLSDTLRYVHSTLQISNALTENANAACEEWKQLMEQDNQRRKVVIAGWSMGAAMACIASHIIKETKNVDSLVYLYGPVIPKHIVKPENARVIYMNTDLMVKYVSCIAKGQEDVEFKKPGGHDISKLYGELLKQFKHPQRGGKNKIVISNRLPYAQTKKRA